MKQIFAVFWVWLSLSGWAYAATCSWDGATVMSGSWLESPSALYRFCQCQPDGRWGNCSNSKPAQSCDWSNPDWNNPACSGGGFKPCDWGNPDSANPSCNLSHSGGSSDASFCATCHVTAPRQGSVQDPGGDSMKVYQAGVTMYDRSCSKCHQPLASSTRKDRTTTQIENARQLHINLEPRNNTWASGWRATAIARALSSEGPPSSGGDWTGGGSSGGSGTTIPPDWTGGSSNPPNWSTAISIQPGVPYQLVSAATGKCLDLKDHNAANGTLYQQWTCTGEPHQKFVFEAMGNGEYQIRNYSSNRCVSVVYGNTGDGDRIHNWDCYSGPDQKLNALNANILGAFNLRFSHSGKCLDLDNGDDWDGAVIQQWSCNSSSAQAWRPVR